jgi:type IV secretory pathway VirB6-like protein
MAQAAQSHGAGGDQRHGMDITDQRQTFSGFLTATVWSCGLIAQSVMLLTLAFAIGAGWWPGVLAFIAIGFVLGLVFRMGGAYWATQIALYVLLILGGIIIPPIAGMMG